MIDGRDGDETTTYSVVVEDDRLTLTEHGPDHDLPAGAADAEVRGSAAAWVQALGPEPDLSGLEISGREELSSLVLDTLSPGELREIAPAAESATS